jgi:DNA-binding LytR/AlgR family response regulator
MADITCIIIEDEKPAQEVLRSFIGKAEWIALRAVFDDAVTALDYLKKNEIDLIFLDIQIPTLTGIEFLKILKDPPQIIITSAYSQYAVEAFELDVRDYLMKPFSFERFLKAVSRVTRPDLSQVHQLRSSTSPGVEKSFAFFNVNKMMTKVMFSDILYVESMREYVYLHTAKNKVVTKMSTAEIEKMLGNGFVRIHRSFIVNVEKITAYNAEDVFIDKVALPIGVSYKKYIEEFFRSSFPAQYRS